MIKKVETARPDNAKRFRERFMFGISLLIIIFMSGCVIQSPNPFARYSQPLREFTIYGKAPEKILVISVKGIISDASKDSFLTTQPSMVEEVVSQLRMAERDRLIKAVILKVDSPGGTTTASDILYNEILRYKRRTGIKLVVMMMGMATSGGYYISLPADYIMAHPTTVTGSVGVVFMRPLAYELMDKIGVSVDIVKSGDKKDMGSPFRVPTDAEKDIFQSVTSDLGNRFISLVKAHRKLGDEALREVASARIFLAEDAVKIGLVDRTGYLEDAIIRAEEMANLSRNAKIVVYRRSSSINDNLYNSSTSKYPGGEVSLVHVDFLNEIQKLGTGFFYLWTPGSDIAN
ncbi:MAG: signal peptide peptidase SppA [Proteobacteria bacterium]|nr:signal peptide peptidase SppA [Pseudomonadota bacterium]